MTPRTMKPPTKPSKKMKSSAAQPTYRNTAKRTEPKPPADIHLSKMTGPDPRNIPEREYAKTEQVHADISALLALKKIIWVDDVMQDLGLTRSNANFHLQYMAAKGLLCLAFEPFRGQNRYVAARDFRALAEWIQSAPPQNCESRPAKA